MFIKYLFTDFQYFISAIVIVIFSVCIHELSHAVVAYQQGDSTAKDDGYCTLDPVKHMGGISIIMLILTGLCWGACPVNPKNFKNNYSDAIISFAGPFANLLLVLIFAFLYIIFSAHTMTFIPYYVKNNLMYFFKLGSTLNAALVIFNLIPIPPLDGSKIAEYFFPSFANFNSNVGLAGLFTLFALFWMFPNFSYLFWEISNFIANNAFTIASFTIQLF